MATEISKDEAYAHLTDVFNRAMGGEEIVIEQEGRPRLKLVPVEEAPQPQGKRVPGQYAGQFSIPDEAFAPLTDEELKDWGY